MNAITHPDAIALYRLKAARCVFKLAVAGVPMGNRTRLWARRLRPQLLLSPRATYATILRALDVAIKAMEGGRP